MADKTTKTFWLGFFRKAGIAPGFDTKYALVFDENRIKMDMLMDINKECLKDMGITAMGDIIAILKHAKHVHEESKTQAYDIPQPSSTSTTQFFSSPLKTGLSGASNSSFGEPRSVIINSSRTISTAPSLAKKFAEKPKSSVSLMTRQITTSNSPPTRSVDVPDQSPAKIGSSTIVRLKRSISPTQREEVPVQKKTRVLPEQEGSYIVKMPVGTTPKTHKLFQDRLGPISSSSSSTISQTQTSKKRSIFSRLGGESNVSSTSDIRRSDSPSSDKKSSVFARLGQGSASPSSPIDRSDFLKTKFEVRQSINSPQVTRIIPSSTISINDRIDRGRAERLGSSSVEPRRDPRTTTSTDSGSRMRSSLGNDSQSVKTRLGFKGTRSRSRSISPPSRGIDSRLERPAVKGNSVTQLLSARPRFIQSANKIGNRDSSETSISRHVVKEERFINAAGKNMIRKTIVKTVRKQK